MNSTQETSYFDEISLMMYGFGDSHMRNPETVCLIEEIVLKQLRSIIHKALKYSKENNLKCEELIFLLRHNKQKMQCFVKYLKKRQIVNTILHARQFNMNDIDDKEMAKNKLIEFIECIDETGEFTDTVDADEAIYERNLRADRISQSLDEQKYLEFSKARRTSFTSKITMQKDLKKLKDWVDPKVKINFEPAALNILAYLAYQTVAEIIDYVLITRMDSKCGTDPLSHLKGCYYTSTMFKEKHRVTETSLDYSKVQGGQSPISVYEVKEVMRRIHSTQPGKSYFGGKTPETYCILTL